MNAILKEFISITQLTTRFPSFTTYKDEITSQDIDALNDVVFVLCQDSSLLDFMTSVDMDKLWYEVRTFIGTAQKEVALSVYDIGNNSVYPNLISQNDISTFTKVLANDTEQYMRYRDIYVITKKINISQNVALKMVWGPITADSSYLVDLCKDAYGHSLGTKEPLLATFFLVERIRSLLYKLYFKIIYNCKLDGIVFEESGYDYIPDRLVSCVLYRRAIVSQDLLNLNYVGPDYNVRVLRSMYEDRI